MSKSSDFPASPVGEWSGEPTPVSEGSEWVYRHAFPRGLLGHRYRVLRVVNHYPSEQQTAIVEGLTGPDAGGWFACTLSVLAGEFAPAPPEPDVSEPAPAEPVPEKVISYKIDQHI